jgi:hypothetical protein
MSFRDSEKRLRRNWGVLILPRIAAALMVFALPGLADTYYVSTEGDDLWSGKISAPNTTGKDGPFATIHKALSVVREQPYRPGKKMEVVLRGGEYSISEPVVISGILASRLVIRNQESEKVVLRGSDLLADCTPQNEKLRCLLPSHLTIQSPLSDGGSRATPAVQLYGNSGRLPVAREPDQGWLAYRRIDTLSPKKRIHFFAPEGKELTLQGNEGWVYGWVNSWFDQYRLIGQADFAAGSFSTRSPLAYDPKPGHRLRFENFIAALDQPGEWYLDAATGSLLLLPPPDTPGDEIRVSVAESIFILQDTRNVTLQGLYLQHARSAAVKVKNSKSIRLENLDIREIDGEGVVIHGGRSVSLTGGEIAHTGKQAVHVTGGDRKTLASSRHRIAQMRIHHFGEVLGASQPGIRLEGVGVSLKNNHIHHGPSMAVLVHGNDHLVSNNEIDHVCLQANDCGAVYSGRDWGYRGNRILKNHIHHIPGLYLARFDIAQKVADFKVPGHGRGIYMDDAVSGFEISGNVLHDIGGRMLQIGGGRDHRIERNIFIGSGPAIQIDSRWQGFPWKEQLIPRLNAMPFGESPWRDRYPELAEPMNNPVWPEGNRIQNNIMVADTDRASSPLSVIVPFQGSVINHNLYWNRDDKLAFNWRILEKELIGRGSFQEWQTTGFDYESSVEYPGFHDVEGLRKGLAEQSPASRLGIDAMPLQGIGPEY